MTSAASADLSRHLWETRYRATGTDGTIDADLDATWRRVARALAAAEPRQRAHWARSFHAALADFRLLPGGRILAGAGTRRRATLFNCFVMGHAWRFAAQYLPRVGRGCADDAAGPGRRLRLLAAAATRVARRVVGRDRAGPGVVLVPREPGAAPT
jgi:hypothetical protein